jgi:hypothetical protein
VIDLEQAAAEALYACPGLTVFVGPRGRPGNRSSIIAGRVPGVSWYRAVECVGGAHRRRADAIVAEYRRRAAG